MFLLNVAQRRLQRWMAARAQASGVTAAQSGLLFILGQRDGVLMGEAGAALDLGPPGISGLVDRMTAAIIATNTISAGSFFNAKNAAVLAHVPSHTSQHHCSRRSHRGVQGVRAICRTAYGAAACSEGKARGGRERD